MSDIVIVAGARTPMGGFQGSLAGVSAVDLGASRSAKRCSAPASPPRTYRK